MARLWLGLVIAIAVCVPIDAGARPRVALAAFAGDPKDHARDAVANVIDRDLSIVDQDETKKKLSDRQLEKLSGELDVDAVVHGKVSGEAGAKVLAVSLFVHGKKSGGFEVEYSSLESKRFKKTVRKRLLAKLDEAKTADGDPPAKPSKKKRVAHRDEADTDADDAPGVKASATIEAAPRAATADRAAARVDLGLSVSSRVLTFQTRTFDQRPPSYHNAGVPGARVAGELYPLAFVDRRSLASGIGIAGSYDKTIGLSVVSPDQPGTKLGVDQHVWSIGARYRVGLGEDRGPSLAFAFDYGHRAFKIDRSMATIDMPDVEYVGFEPGLDARLPVGRTFALFAGGRAILLRSAGDIQSQSQYGRAHVAGGRASVGLDIALGSNIAMRLAGEAAVLKMTFYGEGAQTTSRDGDPTTVDVGGATDSYYGGSATLAVFY